MVIVFFFFFFSLFSSISLSLSLFLSLSFSPAPRRSSCRVSVPPWAQGVALPRRHYTAWQGASVPGSSRLLATFSAPHSRTTFSHASERQKRLEHGRKRRLYLCAVRDNLSTLFKKPSSHCERATRSWVTGRWERFEIKVDDHEMVFRGCNTITGRHGRYVLSLPRGFVSLLIYRVREKKKFVKCFKNITHYISGRYNYWVRYGNYKTGIASYLKIIYYFIFFSKYWQHWKILRIS